MGTSGKDLAGIFKSITLLKVRRVEGLSFLRNGGVTYVTSNGVDQKAPAKLKLQGVGYLITS